MLRPAPDIATYPLDDALVLQRRDGQGVILNATAARLWLLCDGSRTAVSLAEAIADDYGMDYRRALVDVQGFVEALRRSRLLETASGPERA